MSDVSRDEWIEEDFALEAEFSDVVSEVAQQQPPVPPVSSKLDRRVKELAGISIMDELEKSWLLGQGPRIILAVLLMFAIGLLFTLY